MNLLHKFIEEHREGRTHPFLHLFARELFDVPYTHSAKKRGTTLLVNGSHIGRPSVRARTREGGRFLCVVFGHGRSTSKRSTSNRT